jgi:hypothetical protein
MAEITTKSTSAAEASPRQLGIPAARLASVVDRTSELSEEVLTSLETSERAAIEALGQFVVTVEEAVPQEIAGTSEVAKKITESGLEMADRLVHVTHDLLRNVVDSTAKLLNSGDGVKPQAAQ